MKRELTLAQIKSKIKRVEFERFDLVVAIAKGGINPGLLIADHLKLPLKILHISFRDENNKPLYKKPVSNKSLNNDYKNNKKLIYHNNKKYNILLKQQYSTNLLIGGQDGICCAQEPLPDWRNIECQEPPTFVTDDNMPPVSDRWFLTRLKIKNKKILIVDDISRTGATLKKAKEILKGNKLKTFVINGKADYSLYNLKGCVKWPW